MSNYKVSVIMPTFNIGEDIKRPINSLLNQTIGFENIEVILVDDYSTDNTRNIIVDYAKKYDNIKYIFLESNSGSAGKPRNIGIKYASSEYVMYLDNDDEYVSEACEILFNKIEEFNSNLVVSSKINCLYKSTDKISENNQVPEFRKINVLDNPEFLYNPFTEYAGAVWSKIFKKEFLLNNNIKCLENLPEDVYFMHKCYYLNPNVIFITNQKLYNHYFYRTNGQSITVTLSSSFLHDTFSLYHELKKLNNSFVGTSKFFNRYNYLFCEVMVFNIITSDASINQKYLLIQEYVKTCSKLNVHFDDIVLYSWHKLTYTKLIMVILLYTVILKFLIKVRKML